MGWRARSDAGDINALCSSIAKQGQIQPIAVRKIEGEWEVVAGVRRMTACQRLGRPVLAVEVSAETELSALHAQLAENVARKDFDVLELGRGFQRQKVLHEQLYPGTKVGATGGRGSGKGKSVRTKADFAKGANPDPAPERATKIIAREIGKGERFVQECIEVANLPRGDLAEIEKSDTASKRNQAVRKVLRKVRVERKRSKLEARAKEAEAKRQEKVEELGPEARRILHMEDNRQFFGRTENGTFQLILTDPPYGQRQSLVAHVARGNISSNFGAWDKLDVGWVVQAAPLLVDGGQLLVFAPLEAIGEYKFICENIGLTWRGAIIWKKTNPGTAHRNVYLSSVEAVCWATRGDRYHFMPWENAGAPEAHNLIEGPVCGGNERLDHPTQKPEWLLERLLRRHAPPGALVLDPFAGVGSTLAVCRRLGLDCVGVEIDPNYVHLARLRLQAG